MDAIEGASNAGNLPSPQERRRTHVVEINFSYPQGLQSRIWRDGLVNILTLRLYRFWASNGLRQRLWVATAIGQDPLEYRGTAHELLRSFALALAIIAPLYLILTALREMLYGNATGLALLAWSYVVGLLVVGAAGSYLARRYILSRTLWRGISGAQDGSCFLYTVYAVLWSACAVITLGGAIPMDAD